MPVTLLVAYSYHVGHVRAQMSSAAHKTSPLVKVQ